MSRWAAVFLGVAIVATILDFGDLTGTAPETARSLFAVFLVVFLISLVRVRTDPRTRVSANPSSLGQMKGDPWKRTESTE